MKKYIVTAFVSAVVYVVFGALNAQINNILLNSLLCFLSLMGVAVFITCVFILIIYNIGQGDPNDQ